MDFYSVGVICLAIERSEKRILGAIERLSQQIANTKETILAATATLADLDAEIAGDLTDATNQIETLLAEVVQNQKNGQDTSTEIAKIKAITAGIRNAIAAATPSPGDLTVDVASVSLSLANGPTATVNVSEANYTGALTPSGLDPAVATFAPAAGTGPGPFAITLTAVAAGSGTLEIDDDHGGKVLVSVSVGA